MSRLVFAAMALITIHTLCKDLASAEVKASPVPSRSLAMSAPKNAAPGHVVTPAGSDMKCGDAKL